MIDGKLLKIDPVDKVKRETDFYLKIEGIKNEAKYNELNEIIPKVGQQFKLFKGNAKESQLIFRVIYF